MVFTASLFDARQQEIVWSFQRESWVIDGWQQVVMCFRSGVSKIRQLEQWSLQIRQSCNTLTSWNARLIIPVFWAWERLPVGKRRSTSARDGKAVLYFSNSSFSFVWVAKVASMFLAGVSWRNDSAIFVALPLQLHLSQARRHGGHSGAVPPQMTACAPPNVNRVPPSEDYAPKKLTGSGLLECKSRPKTPKLVFTGRIFVNFVDSHRIS